MTAPNVIVIVLDSLRKDHVGCYGGDKIDTGPIDELARDPYAIKFTNAYPEALPTIPIRTSLFTGQRTLPFRPWEPLHDEDITITEILSKNGYLSTLITDTYHMMKPGMNFHRGFDSFSWIRGQEADPYKVNPQDVDIEPYIKQEMIGSETVKMLRQYLRNTYDRDDSSDHEFFSARLVSQSIEWLENNYENGPYFLWIDSFDPHEPWDPPSSHRGKYTDTDYSGPDLIHPKYGSVDWMDPEELEYVKGLYAEESEFVIKQIGRLLNKVRELGVYDSSLIVFLSDHGHPHGEHGSIMKTADNLYSELLEIPLIIKVPSTIDSAESLNNQTSGMVQTNDVPVTILDILGLKRESEAMHGRSLLPLMFGDARPVRNSVITGYHESPHRCIRNEEWSLIVRPDGTNNELYDLQNDPKETNNLIDDRSEVATGLKDEFGKYYHKDDRIEMLGLQERYETSGTPAEQ